MTSRTLLIADDEPHLSRILAYNLEKTEATVVTACNGAECLDLAEKHHPDLIISDYQMPVLDGLQACTALKANPLTAHIPVIMLTARGHRLSNEEIERTNIQCLMPKPFSARQVVAKVDELLGATAPSKAAA